MVLTTTNSWQIVPNEPLASGDFTNIATNNAADGVYTLNGAPCDLTDIIDVGNSNGNFNPAVHLDSDGITPNINESGTQEVSLYLKDPLLAQIIPGYTAVFEVTLASTDVGGFTTSTLNSFMFDDPNWNIAAGAQLTYGEGIVDRVRLTDTSYTETNFNDALGSAGTHKVALTATAEKMVVSVDGGAPLGVAAAGVDPSCNGYGFNIGGDPAARLRSFAFYDVVDDADLPALSAL